ncbi:MAG: hypothetical protein V1891_01640 [bacterium]
MFTIFTVPKPFTDPHISIIQENSIRSWKRLSPFCEIILIGNEKGIAEIAKKLNVAHINNVKYNELGTPLLNSAFELAQKKANYNILCYLNCDIILLSDFIDVIKILPKRKFLAVGRRWDIDISDLLNSNNSNFESILKDLIKKSGKLHSYAGIDYFIFQKNLLKNIPPFAVGRVGWDNWMIYEARRKKIAVIDITEMATVLHQNHNYPKFNKGSERKTNFEAKKNCAYLKGSPYFFTIEDANYKLTHQGLLKKWLYFLPFLKRYIKNLFY